MARQMTRQKTPQKTPSEDRNGPTITVPEDQASAETSSGSRCRIPSDAIPSDPIPSDPIPSDWIPVTGPWDNQGTG